MKQETAVTSESKASRVEIGENYVNRYNGSEIVTVTGKTRANFEIAYADGEKDFYAKNIFKRDWIRQEVIA